MSMPRLETKRDVQTLPPARNRAVAVRTFVVRCITCDRHFQVDRAPAPCPFCGGIAVAG